MALIKVRYRVDIIESERDWGSKVDEVKYFDEEKEAKEFVATFNAKNNKETVPDWYMYATDPTMEVV